MFHQGSPFWLFYSWWLLPLSSWSPPTGAIFAPWKSWRPNWHRWILTKPDPPAATQSIARDNIEKWTLSFAKSNFVCHQTDICTRVQACYIYDWYVYIYMYIYIYIICIHIFLIGCTDNVAHCCTIISAFESIFSFLSEFLFAFILQQRLCCRPVEDLRPGGCQGMCVYLVRKPGSLWSLCSISCTWRCVRDSDEQGEGFNDFSGLFRCFQPNQDHAQPLPGRIARVRDHPEAKPRNFSSCLVVLHGPICNVRSWRLVDWCSEPLDGRLVTMASVGSIPYRNRRQPFPTFLPKGKLQVWGHLCDSHCDLLDIASSGLWLWNLDWSSLFNRPIAQIASAFCTDSMYFQFVRRSRSGDSLVAQVSQKKWYQGLLLLVF